MIAPFPQHPGGPASPRRPAGSDQEDPAWPGFFSRPPSGNTGWAEIVYSGWPGRHSPCPGRITSLAGRINTLQADLAPPGPRFTPSGTYYSFGIDSIALCQSWDVSRLGLARPPSLYAGLGMPLGSDQHTPPLLVSLILRRRIRLMTWRS
jgi:hypothetical protein